jgi:hypothetical protein
VLGVRYLPALSASRFAGELKLCSQCVDSPPLMNWRSRFPHFNAICPSAE